VQNWYFVDRRPRASADGFALPNATPQQPNYNAAGQGRRLRMWRVPTSGPNWSVARDLPTIRARARAAYRNDPWAGTALDKLDSNGIATGIQAKGWPAAEPLYKRFMDECDADGVLDGYGQQYLAWHEWNEVGEVFGRLRARRPSDPLAVPLQVQIIEAELCPVDLYTVAANGNQIKAGIEFDAIGRRVAYYFYREHPGDAYLSVNGNELTRVPADQVIHLYRPTRAGQIRGIPDHTSVLVRMFNLENMDDAVLERQKIANMFAGFYTTPIDPENPPDSVLDGMTRDEDGTQETDVDDTPLAGLEPGTMQELPVGMKAEFSNPPAPGTEYSEFLRGNLLAVAARHGVPFEVLTGDLRDISDRALKLLLNEFRRGLEMRQWLFFIPRWCQRIRTEFFDTAVLSGRLQLADYSQRRAEYVETLWVPQGWPYSHPVQDVVADVKAIRAGLDTRYAAILRTGEDPEKVDQQNAADNARADELGLVLDSDARKTTPAGKPAGASADPSSSPPDDPVEENADATAK